MQHRKRIVDNIVSNKHKIFKNLIILKNSPNTDCLYLLLFYKYIIMIFCHTFLYSIFIRASSAVKPSAAKSTMLSFPDIIYIARPMNINISIRYPRNLLRFELFEQIEAVANIIIRLTVA